MGKIENTWNRCSLLWNPVPLPSMLAYTTFLGDQQHIFIGPESDHWLCLSVTDSLTDSCLVNLIDVTCGLWRCQLKTCWGCYCCWCWWPMFKLQNDAPGQDGSGAADKRGRSSFPKAGRWTLNKIGHKSTLVGRTTCQADETVTTQFQCWWRTWLERLRHH